MSLFQRRAAPQPRDIANAPTLGDYDESQPALIQWTFELDPFGADAQGRAIPAASVEW
ncbi:MAG: hypothetical protein Q7S58_06365 [Candidatus Binatus sp.]|nr:hypothetical protein [Candidatus Binatus sp.]